MNIPDAPHDVRAMEAILRELLGRSNPLWTNEEAEALYQKINAPSGDEHTGPPIRWQDPIIEEAIPSRSSVLDLGCGEGDLLARLIRDKYIRAQGVEYDADAVRTCITRGVPVLQCDLDAGLRGFADDSFDTVVMEETLQTLHQPLRILEEMLRVGRRGIVSFPNFGAWRIRLSLTFEGRMPVTERLPYHWYDTPNIHLLTIRDFLEWIRTAPVHIAAAFVLRNGQITSLESRDMWYADEALFFLERG